MPETNITAAGAVESASDRSETAALSESWAASVTEVADSRSCANVEYGQFVVEPVERVGHDLIVVTSCRLARGGRCRMFGGRPAWGPGTCCS